MSTTSGVNVRSHPRDDTVLRYSALAFGVFYGFTHQRSITASQKAAAAQKEYQHKQHLIEQARAEYTKKKNPPSASAEKAGLKQDPMDPNFDLEAYLSGFEKA
ncbi:Uu.00g015110.m01.CDS01 [Anthostomella pinea]|uniref:ATP synthase F(0) complex subunit e, mitochondrial n=1 Tax=Anthostomella pinea TaxID=933095 RepID=A0AAI8VYH9_9PEZI|nr:Uu.00g015110.m01.CDS01 [Anthostomella pinea]